MGRVEESTRPFSLRRSRGNLASLMSVPLHLDILPAPQRKLWPELRSVPSEFTLYGGTALALRLGHRRSVDFDFFSRTSIDPRRLLQGSSLLVAAQPVQIDVNTLTVLLGHEAPVKLSFFGLPWLGCVEPPDRASDNQVAVASLIDLAATKIEVIQARAESKDYLDLDALLQRTSIDLTQALAAARTVFGVRFNPQISLKALSYFGDLPDLPLDVQQRLAACARAVDLDRV
jgi:hypothetical protein